MIQREDMLELTRRMTSQRTHLVRLAGAYMDDEGYIDGNFNTNFLNLKGEERNHSIDIAKQVIFSETNKELLEYKLPQGAMKPGSIWQLLYALRDCDLKNDAMLMTLYEVFGERFTNGMPYAIYVYEGIYDVPIKAADKEKLDVSEEVYKYLIVAICPLTGDYEAGLPTDGFLWPAFKDRSSDMSYVNIYGNELAKILLD